MEVKTDCQTALADAGPPAKLVPALVLPARLSPHADLCVPEGTWNRPFGLPPPGIISIPAATVMDWVGADAVPKEGETG